MIKFILLILVSFFIQSNPNEVPNSTQTDILTPKKGDHSRILDLTHTASVDKAGLCKIHHETLKTEQIRMHYGYFVDGEDESYNKAEKKLFPNAVTSIEVCSAQRINSKTIALVLQCQKCLQKKTNWIYQQRKRK